jgi:ABC-type nitrate/sulfonate/bicarbonate transport system permease component
MMSPALVSALRVLTGILAGAVIGFSLGVWMENRWGGPRF